MKIFGIGTDIVNINRLKKIFLKNGTNFKKKIFSNNEIIYCERKKNPVSFYAKRFEAKEDFSKALGKCIRKEIKFKDITISNDSFGKPFIRLSGSTKKYLIKQLKTKKYFIYLSLSDDLPWAQATVIISYTK